LKVCSFCGNQLDEVSIFCDKCGAKVARQPRKKTQLEKDLESRAAAEIMLPAKDEVQVRAKIKPPPSAVKSIRELIYWEYAKLIAEAAKMDGNYRFIMNRYMKLKKGEIVWASPDEDMKKDLKTEAACVYCGSKDDLAVDHLIPLSKGGPERIDNCVCACKRCNSSKLDRDIFEWYYLVKRQEKIPREIWKRYLKIVWDFHIAHRTLDRVDLNRDGKLDIQDIGAVFKRRRSDYV